MSYRKIGEDKYKIVVELGTDMFGKRKRITKVIHGSIEDAISEEEKMSSEFYHKKDTFNIENITFNAYSDMFLENYCKENVSLVTIKSYKQLLGKIKPIIGNLKMKKINTFILDNMYSYLKHGEVTKIRKPETMLHYYRLINVMFSRAVKWGIIENNPNENTIKPKRERIERNCYDINQVRTLLECLQHENIKYRALITFALDSGARRGEICALKWDDIDFENRVITIDNSLKVVEGKVDEDRAKNSYSIRKIVISESCIRILKEYKEWQDECKKQLGRKWKDQNRVFTSPDGSHIHPDSCTDILYKIIKKYNLPKITFHELRHTCTSLLIDSGVNIKAVSLRLGHANTNTTMNIYTHAYESSNKDINKTMDKIIEM